MKKLFLIITILCLIFSNLFGMDFSIGPTVGSEVIQSYSTYTGSTDSYPYPSLLARPNLGFVSNFDFDNFGIQFDVNFSFSKLETAYYNSTKKIYDRKLKEGDSTINICLIPYYSFVQENFKISVGPVLGFSFYNYNSEQIDNLGNKQSQSKDFMSEFIWGGEVSFSHDLNSKMDIYLSLPILANTGLIDRSYKIDGTESKTTKNKYFGISKKLYAIPKMGILFKF